MSTKFERARFDADTSLARGAAAFPSTRWSTLLRSIDAPGSGPDSDATSAYLERLAALYWRPVYAYVRARWAQPNEDAKDLTQDFFVWILESGFLARADPGKGRFRSFVKVALEHFLTDAERGARRIKRGGAHRFVPLDAEAGAQYGLPDAAGRSPDELLDETWRRELLARAVQLLADGYRCEGRTEWFEVFRDYFLAEEELDYAAVAERYGLKRSDVSNRLQHAKRRYREVLRNAIADTVQSEEALREELAWFFAERR